MECMVARERTAGARTECLAQIFGRHVPDGREVRRCVGPEQVRTVRLRANVTPTLVSLLRSQTLRLRSTKDVGRSQMLLF